MDHDLTGTGGLSRLYRVSMAMAGVDEYDAELPLIEAVRGGNERAFGKLVRRHGRWVRGVVFSVLGDRDGVDDVTQQVWTAAWQRFGELREAHRWRAWLYRLARNAALDAGRRTSRRRGLFATAARVDAEVHNDRPDRALADNELRQDLLNAIRTLPAMYREPFVLRHVNGWSYRQIAEAMDMPVDSIETRLVRARRMLREALKDKL